MQRYDGSNLHWKYIVSTFGILPKATIYCEIIFNQKVRFWEIMFIITTGFSWS